MNQGVDEDEAGRHPVAEIDPDEVREPLRRLYDELDTRIAEHGPVCAVSGRCCRFREYGHTLFLSAAEAALLVADAPPPSRPIDEGATCPWQDQAGRCTAREARPLGCRVYFCDPNFEGKAEPISEEFLARLRQLAEARGLPWGYARLHHHVNAAVEAGILRIESAGDGEPREAMAIRNAVSVRESLDISPSDQ